MSPWFVSLAKRNTGFVKLVNMDRSLFAVVTEKDLIYGEILAITVRKPSYSVRKRSLVVPMSVQIPCRNEATTDTRK